jgi:transposase
MNGNPRTAAFKKKIAIEALKGERTVNEIAKEYGIHPVQMAQWKKALIDGAETHFMGCKRKKTMERLRKQILREK